MHSRFAILVAVLFVTRRGHPFIESVAASGAPAASLGGGDRSGPRHPVVQRARSVRVEAGRARQGQGSRTRPTASSSATACSSASACRRGHLLTESAYRDYRLEVEYRFPGKPGNCGVLVHASRLRALSAMFPQSIEVQMNHLHAGDFWCIEENIEVPDMEARRPRKEGQKYGGSDGDARRILNLTDNSEKPLGEWNTMVVEARGRTLKVTVNGDLVNEGFNSTADRGQIAIQAEGAEVEFRRVQIGPLPPPSK